MIKIKITAVLPVKDNKGILWSFDIASPIFAPPETREQISPGNLFSSKTFEIILVTATLDKFVVGAPFLILD